MVIIRQFVLNNDYYKCPFQRAIFEVAKSHKKMSYNLQSILI